MLGHKLVQQLGKNNSVVATIRSDAEALSKAGISENNVITGVDITNPSILSETIRSVSPDVVINAIGAIKQKSQGGGVVSYLKVNSIFPHDAYAACQEVGARFITISTDCVFTGVKGSYTENDIPDAVDLYGTSKRLGEINVPGALTLRTSIIGRELSGAHGLLEWFLSNRGGKVKGFAKAVFSGFPTVVLAKIIGWVIDEHPQLSGLYHVSSEPINKYDLALMFNEHYDAGIDIERFEDFQIDRSLDSSRFRELTGFVPESWDEMVRIMASDPTPYEKIRSTASA